MFRAIEEWGQSVNRAIERLVPAMEEVSRSFSRVLGVGLHPSWPPGYTGKIIDRQRKRLHGEWED